MISELSVISVIISVIGQGPSCLLIIVDMVAISNKKESCPKGTGRNMKSIPTNEGTTPPVVIPDEITQGLCDDSVVQSVIPHCPEHNGKLTEPSYQTNSQLATDCHPDCVTILSAMAKNLPRKVLRYTVDGVVVTQATPRIKAWIHNSVALPDNIEELCVLLTKASKNPRNVLIHGRTLHDGEETTRSGATIDCDKPDRLLTLDLDKHLLATPFDIFNPLLAVEQVRDDLELSNISVMYQLTASASTQHGKEFLSVRFYLFFDQPITRQQRKSWMTARKETLGLKSLDLSMTHTAQIIYLATPEIIGGPDTLDGKRFGCLLGEQDYLHWVEPQTVKHVPEYSANDGPVRSRDSFLVAVARIGKDSLHGAVLRAVWAAARENIPKAECIGTIQEHGFQQDYGTRQQAYIQRELSAKKISDSYDGARAKLIAGAPATTELPDYIVPIYPGHPISIAEARARLPGELKRAVEEGGVYLHIGPPGLGKTRALTKLPLLPPYVQDIQRGQQIAIATPTLALADEIATAFNEVHGKTYGRPVAMVIRGREAINHDDGKPMCQRHELVRAAIAKGRPDTIATLICSDPFDRPGMNQCPYETQCAWWKQRAGMHRHQVHVFAHENIFTPFHIIWGQARVLIVDENTLSSAWKRWRPDMECEKFNELMKTPWADIVAAIKAGQKLSGLPNRDKLVTALEQLIDESSEGKKKISSIGTDDMISLAIKEMPEPKYPSMWEGATRAAIRMLKGKTINELWWDKNRLCGAWRKTLSVVASATIALDGTGNPEVWSAILSELTFEPDPNNKNILLETRVPLKVIGSPIEPSDLKAEIIQYPEKSYRKKHLLADKNDKNNSDELRKSAAGRILYHRDLCNADSIICQKSIKELMPEGAFKSSHHFGALRGMNDMEQATGLVVVGRPEPGTTDVEAMARALWPNAELTLTGRYQRQRARIADGHYVPINGHADPRCNAVLQATRDAEVGQAVARIRPYGEARQVHVLTNVPLPWFPVKVAQIDVPEPVLRIFGITQQANLTPCGGKQLRALGFNHDDGKQVMDWFKQRGRYSVTFRVVGQRGGSEHRFAALRNTGDIQAQIEAIIHKQICKLTVAVSGTTLPYKNTSFISEGSTSSVPESKTVGCSPINTQVVGEMTVIKGPYKVIVTISSEYSIAVLEKNDKDDWTFITLSEISELKQKLGVG